eukprot:9795069-Lingulodinium_polyedra.AAC.1
MPANQCSVPPKCAHVRGSSSDAPLALRDCIHQGAKGDEGARAELHGLTPRWHSSNIEPPEGVDRHQFRGRRLERGLGRCARVVEEIGRVPPAPLL